VLVQALAVSPAGFENLNRCFVELFRACAEALQTVLRSLASMESFEDVHVRAERLAVYPGRMLNLQRSIDQMGY